MSEEDGNSKNMEKVIRKQENNFTYFCCIQFLKNESEIFNIWWYWDW